MKLYPRIVVEDGQILFKINVDGVEHISAVSEGLALALIKDLAGALQWADADTSHPSDADHPVPVR